MYEYKYLWLLSGTESRVSPSHRIVNIISVLLKDVMESRRVSFVLLYIRRQIRANCDREANQFSVWFAIDQ